MEKVIFDLAHRFSIKELDSLSYFLGVEILSTPIGVFLSQKKYISDLLDLTKVHVAKLVSSPISSTQVPKLTYGTILTDPLEYCLVVGSLQELSMTHLDLAFDVNKLSLFMHRLTTVH